MHTISDRDVAFEKGAWVLPIVLTATPAFVDMRLTDALVMDARSA